MMLASPNKSELQHPQSPLAVNSRLSSSQKEQQQEEEKKDEEAEAVKVNGMVQGKASAGIESPLGKIGQNEVAQSATICQEAEEPNSSTVTYEISQNEAQNAESATEPVMQKDVITAKHEKEEMAGDSQLQSKAEKGKEDCEQVDEVRAVFQTVPNSKEEAVQTSEKSKSLAEVNTEISESSSGETPELHPADVSPDSRLEEAEAMLEPESPSVASELPASDVSSDILQDDNNKSLERSDDQVEEKMQSDELALGSGIEQDVVSIEPPQVAIEAMTSQSSDTPSLHAMPLDSIKEIRDLVVEVIEVEEPLHHYPGVGGTKEE